MADGLRHTAVLHRATQKVWIVRTGGFVGVYQWYGPVSAIEASVENCPLEPAVAQKPGTPAHERRVGSTSYPT